MTEKELLAARQSIVQKLTQARLEKGLSQEQLAKRIGTQRSNICRIEKGTQNLSLDLMLKIAEALDKDVSVTLEERSGTEVDSESKTETRAEHGIALPCSARVVRPADVRRKPQRKGEGGTLNRVLRLSQPLRPLGLPEACQDKRIAYQQRTLDQHTVRGQKLQHCILAHIGQLVLQTHGLVEQAAGIEKFLQRQSAALMPCGQLVIGGVFQLDVPKDIVDVVFVQPFFRLLAGGAFGIAEKDHVLCS